MVLMMMLTLIPANMAFAGSDASATVTQTSSDGDVRFEARIKSEGTGIATLAPTTPGVFEIVLGDNAEWVDSNNDDDYLDEFLAATISPASVVPVRATSNRVEFRINALVPAGTNIDITGVRVKFDGAAEGDQKFTVRDVRNSGIGTQNVTYAGVIGSGSVFSRRLSDVKTLTRGLGTPAQFELREATGSAIKPGNLQMRLPRDVSWDNTTTVTINDNPATLVDITGTTPPTAFGDRVLTVKIAAGDITPGIDRIVVTPKINVTKDARLGDIEVEFLGGTTEIDADSLKIAEYKDYGITVKVDKVKEIVAGKEESTKDYTVKVTLEPAGKSFNTNRPIDFEVINGEVKLKSSKQANGINNINGAYDSEFEATPGAIDKDMEFEFYVKAAWDGTKPVELKVSGGGVDEQTVKMAEVAAVAKLSAKIDTKEVADVVIGLQNQAAPTITLAETKAGSITEGWYTFDFSGARYEGARFADAGLKATVKSGNISVDKVKLMNNNKTLVMKIDGESTKEASTIEISGLAVNLDRTVPYGQIDLRFAAVGTPAKDAGGNIIFNKYDDTILAPSVHERNIDFVDNEVKKIATVPYLNVVTEVQTARTQKTVFTLDSTTYTVGSETKTLDAAPYISNNRTMLPIGTVAQLAGATLNYSPSTRTAVFTKDNLVVSMNLDTNILLVNGSPVPMDAKPEIVNSRAFVPVVYVAQAFGIQNGTDIVYDAATKTVTLFPNAK